MFSFKPFLLLTHFPYPFVPKLLKSFLPLRLHFLPPRHSSTHHSISISSLQWHGLMKVTITFTLPSHNGSILQYSIPFLLSSNNLHLLWASLYHSLLAFLLSYYQLLLHYFSVLYFIHFSRGDVAPKGAKTGSWCRRVGGKKKKKKILHSIMAYSLQRATVQKKPIQ